ncbi:MAG: hypothetical protein P9M11_04720 [Candidatus Tenebribacter burtonii]|nr:hypothetical protein [Candidatus Tenebribacter burtonii]
MMKNNLACSFVFLLLLITISLAAKIEIDLESGVIFSGYNDVAIPGDTGTRFSLSEELDTKATPFYRLRLFYDFNSKHHLGVLFAPLTIKSGGSLDRDLIYQNEIYAQGTALDVKYQFNSYRLVYRYDFLRKEKLQIGAGFTAKIRDAIIRVSGNGISSSKENVGFVPILHFRLVWNFHDKFSLLMDGDALAAPQGRAEDVLAAIVYQVSDKIKIKTGYRLLEGGADNDEVYTFSLFHYAVLGIMINF